MNKLDITPTLIGNLIGEVAPLVEQETGWTLELESMHHSVIAKNDTFEVIVLERLQALGAPCELLNQRGLVERLIEYVVEANVLGAYNPDKSELCIVAENVDESNPDGIRVVLAHELVHRGQHVHHRALFERMDDSMRAALKAFLQDPPDFSFLEQMDRAQSTMSLIESHATYVQLTLQQKYFSGAVIESHFSLATLLLRLFGGAKIAQYSDGIPAIVAASSREGIDLLYRNHYG